MQRITWQLPQEPLWQQAQSIVHTLQQAGFAAVYVGGCVRDHLLQEPVADIDIASNAPAEVVEDLFPHTVAVGKAFGVIIVVDQGRHFEVAQFRHDGPSSDGRHPDSVQASNEREDVLRRDFTINALLADPLQGEIRDYVQGLEDLTQRRLRLVGDPHQRLREDRLRILRAARFAARFACSICPHTLQALQEIPCQGLSRERICSECDKVFGQPWQLAWLQFLREWGQIAVFAPCQDFSDALMADLQAWWTSPHAHSPLVAEALLWYGIIEHRLISVAQWQEWYQQQPRSRQHSASITATLSDLSQVQEALPPAPQRQRLARQKHAPIVLACLRAMAAATAQDFADCMEDESSRGPIPQLLSAKDLMALGIARGPQLGATLRHLEDAWLKGDIHSPDQARSLVLSQSK